MELRILGCSGGEAEGERLTGLLVNKSVAIDAGSLTGAPDRERYTIHNAVSVLNGSSDMTAARTRAYAILADLGAAIAADPRLGGAVMRAQIAAANLTQSQTQQGALAEIVFDVDCDAFTRR